MVLRVRWWSLERILQRLAIIVIVVVDSGLVANVVVSLSVRDGATVNVRPRHSSTTPPSSSTGTASDSPFLSLAGAISGSSFHLLISFLHRLEILFHLVIRKLQLIFGNLLIPNITSVTSLVLDVGRKDEFGSILPHKHILVFAVEGLVGTGGQSN